MILCKQGSISRAIVVGVMGVVVGTMVVADLSCTRWRGCDSPVAYVGRLVLYGMGFRPHV